MSKCTYCGAQIPDKDEYCPVCHARIPTKYDDKGIGDFTGTYGHTDCWEMDDSRYRVEDWETETTSTQTQYQSEHSEEHSHVHEIPLPYTPMDHGTEQASLGTNTVSGTKTKNTVRRTASQVRGGAKKNGTAPGLGAVFFSIFLFGADVINGMTIAALIVAIIAVVLRTKSNKWKFLSILSVLLGIIGAVWELFYCIALL